MMAAMRDTKEEFMRALHLVPGHRDSDRLYQAMRVGFFTFPNILHHIPPS